ncbi:MAG: helix-turn-helix domain-containing protein [Eubacteriales bacterium]
MSERQTILTISEAVEYTRLSKPTLYRMTSTKKIPFLKVGGKVLFRLEELTAWLNAQSVEPEVNHV